MELECEMSTTDGLKNEYSGEGALNGGAAVGMTANSHALSVQGTLPVTKHGTSGDDILDGGELADHLYGEYGNDILNGLGGNDYLDGGWGDDILNGGDGNDHLYGGIGGADTMDGGNGDDAFYVDSSLDRVIDTIGGNDRLYSSISFVLPNTITTLVLVGKSNINGSGSEQDDHITGNDGDNVLSGGAGADWLSGGLGDDRLYGGSGDDTYEVENIDDRALESVGGGTDTVISSASSFALEANIENLVIVSHDGNGTGNALNNVITGTDGTNVLDGGIGADRLTGMNGNDTYYVDNAHDVVIETNDNGIDTVLSQLSYVLTSNVENLTLLGNGNYYAFGNSLDNELQGNSSDNRLDGLGGADVMIGGIGSDTYVVDNIGDLVAEYGDTGIDLVEASVSYVLTENVENLTLTGTANINGTGNWLDNTVIGNAGANVLSGGGGIDSLYGGLGNDTYMADSTAASALENANEGIDTVFSSVKYMLGANIENLTLTGTLDRNGNGNGLDNLVTGNSGNNILRGLDGNDTLDGGVGSDSLYGGLGADVFLFGSSSGSDTVRDFSAAQNDLFNVNAYTHGTAFGDGTTITSDGLGNTVINLGGGNIVTVTGAGVSDVTAHMVW